MKTFLCALMGGGAMVVTALAVGMTATEHQLVAGTGMGSVNTYVQPTGSVMTTAVTIPPAPPNTALATSLASPTLKATPLPAECNTSGLCP